MIKVLIADDHMLLRAGLKRILEEAPDINIVAEVSSGGDAIKEFERVHPDVVIMDISMPVMDGLEATRELLKRNPNAQVLVLTRYPGEEYGARILKAGALGYVTKKGASIVELISAIRAVAAGRPFISAEDKDIITLSLLGKKSDMTPVENLSDRELQVLCLLASGKKLQEIASALSLSINTIATYRSRVLDKLDLRTNADLARFAVEHRLL